MRETRFIESNQEKWKEFEYYLDSNNISPEDLHRMYIQITDDLSFARTFYPNRSVRVYLNYLSQRIFSHLNKTKKSPVGQFVHFWRYGLPQVIWESRWEFLLAFVTFMLAVAIGVVSTMIDSDFPTMILGEDYVQQTIKNIESGDPMAIYKSGSAFGSTAGITANNIFVALRTFVFGILAGIGSLYILLQNGIMVGCFQYFFVSRGFGLDATLAIWLHGTFEISAIVIAGAAGLTLGKGMLFPGTYRRLQAFQRSAHRGFQIIVGTLPLFIVAGFVEGTFTRYTQAPTVVRASFIILCAAIVIYYFVYYPYYISKKNITNSLKDSIIPPDDLEPLRLNQIRSMGEIIGDTFFILRKKIEVILGLCMAFAFVYIAFFFYLSNENPAKTIAPQTEPIPQLLELFRNENVPYWWLIGSVLATFFATMVTLVIKKIDNSDFSFNLKDFFLVLLNILPTCLVFNLIVQLSNNGAVVLLLFLFFTLLLLWHWESAEQRNAFSALGTVISFFTRQFSYFGAIFLLSLFCFVTYFLLNTVLFGLVWDFIKMNLQFNSQGQADWDTIFTAFCTAFSIFLAYAIFIIAGGLIYFNIKEIEYGESLLNQIEKISLKRNVRGLELE